MGEYRVQISDLAKRGIRNIVSYINTDLQEPAIAAKTADAILDAISTLKDIPARIAFVNEERLAEKGIRRLIINHYSAFFRVNERQKIVDVIRVLFSRRDWLAYVVVETAS